MSPSERCETRAGSYRCERPAGHEGACEAVEEAAPWVGPALSANDVARRVASLTWKGGKQ